jgi:hypothetical protein
MRSAMVNLAVENLRIATAGLGRTTGEDCRKAASFKRAAVSARWSIWEIIARFYGKVGWAIALTLHDHFPRREQRNYFQQLKISRADGVRIVL